MGWWKRFKDGLSGSPNDGSGGGCSRSVSAETAKLFPKEGLSQHIQVVNTAKTLKFFKCPIFLDIETTGLNSEDRIVSLSIVRCMLGSGKPKVQAINLVFDPLKKSHPMAENIHQLDDWMLRHQDLFGEHIEAISEMIESGDCLVAHNANFDIPFLEREFERWGHILPKKPVFCTMIEARSQGWRPANLGACAAHIGIRRQSAQHLAIEDALMCMSLWFYWMGLGFIQPKPGILNGFSNIRQIPPRPDILPRRNNKKKLSIFYQTQPEAV